jgi:hypothetical protein
MSLWHSNPPDDEGLERLNRRYANVLDPDVLRAEMLRASAADDLDPVDVVAIRPRPLRFKKNRFLVLVDVDTPDGRLELVAKGYWDDRARRVFENHRLLWNAGLGDRSAPTRTSRPFGVLERLGATLTERLPGEHPPRADVAAAKRMGRAAAFLHGCAAPLEPRVDLDGALRALDLRLGRLEAAEPVLAAGALRLAERARALANRLPVSARDEPLQGDLGRTSFLLDGDQSFLLDWDACCRFDPAWEVGHFLVQLLRSGVIHGVDTTAVQEGFLRSYLRARANEGYLEHRIAYYRSIACLFKAYRVTQIERRGWPYVLVELLRSADSGLAELE